MQKRTRFPVLGLGLLLVSSGLLRAQTASGSMTSIGPVTLTWGAPGKLIGNRLLLPGGVRMASTNYGLTAETISVDLASGKKGAYGIAKATAEGDPAKGTQVDGRFESVALALTYLVSGNHAVYTPDTSRPGGGKIDFNGRVVIRLQDPQALNGDAVTHVEQATVLLGKGAAYPKMTFSAGHLELTPLQ